MDMFGKVNCNADLCQLRWLQHCEILAINSVVLPCMPVFLAAAPGLCSSDWPHWACRSQRPSPSIAGQNKSLGRSVCACACQGGHALKSAKELDTESMAMLNLEVMKINHASRRALWAWHCWIRR
eukprot:scaffold82056_cov18-Tisochrysis_lutea.AAC.2